MYVHSHQTISTSYMYNFDIFSLGPNHSYFAQGIYLIDKTENIPCAILEWSNTILELRNQVGILTLRRAILEWYRFLLCAEHIHWQVPCPDPEGGQGYTGQCKCTGGCYNELVVAFFSTGGGVKGKKIYTC